MDFKISRKKIRQPKIFVISKKKVRTLGERKPMDLEICRKTTAYTSAHMQEELLYFLKATKNHHVIQSLYPKLCANILYAFLTHD